MTPKNKKKETETAQATPVADVSGIVPVPAEESSAVAGQDTVFRSDGLPHRVLSAGVRRL